MKCYKNGGCGVYEMRSCSDCPASKPEYADKADIIKDESDISEDQLTLWDWINGKDNENKDINE